MLEKAEAVYSIGYQVPKLFAHVLSCQNQSNFPFEEGVLEKPHSQSKRAQTLNRLDSVAFRQLKR
jgi:hypothetical protein